MHLGYECRFLFSPQYLSGHPRLFFITIIVMKRENRSETGTMASWYCVSAVLQQCKNTWQMQSGTSDKAMLK